ncbi:MAG: hydroxymethylpyrimidine/phosphomethylpyrimidine kinase [Deltaproteobacteria bacterium]|nr:hydroxymethylpyrimidine/phosphomethylpyrimidine kinase [Deltaproteobacteria bacterium]
MTISGTNDHAGRKGAPILIVSAMDSSGAAGMALDVRVIESLHFAVRCALTAVTIQGDDGVVDVRPLPPALIRLTIRTAFTDAPGIAGVKIGMLADAATAFAVAESLEPIARSKVPIVVDPVVRSTSGSPLIDDDGLDVLLHKLLPMCSLATPNREEALALAERRGIITDNEEDAAAFLLALGVGAVLVTGGEGTGEACTDTLYLPSGDTVAFQHPRVKGPVPRGTGCALSSAFAAHAAVGFPLEKAVHTSIDMVAGLIESSTMVGRQRLLFPGDRSD